MVEDVFLPGIETVIEDIVRVSIDDSDQLTDNDFAVTETTRAVTYGTTSQTITALNLTATLEDLPAGTYTIDETGYDVIDVDHPELGWIVAIRNDAGVALPSTGGPGTDLIYLLGIILTSLAGLGLVMRKRRRAI